MDREIKDYVNHVLKILDSEKFFKKAGLFMDRRVFKTFLQQMVQKNYEETNSFVLKENQLDELINKTMKFLIEETFEDLIKDDLIEVKGMNEEGDFLYGPKEI